MFPQSRKIKSTLALTLALGAIAPAAASAQPLRADPPGWPASTAPRQVTHNVSTTARPPATVVEVSSPGGLDWGDAGIGAAAGLGLSMFVVGGGVLVARHHGRHTAS